MARGYVDLEQMLLSESDEELLGIIRREQAAEAGAPLSGALQRLMFIRAGRITDHASVDASQFPPKYSDAQASAAVGGSVFRHTFGQRAQAFGFDNSGVPIAVKLQPAMTATPVSISVPVVKHEETLQEGASEAEDVDMEADAAATPVATLASATNCSPTGSTIMIKKEVVVKQEPVHIHELNTSPVTPERPQPVLRTRSQAECKSPQIPAAFASPSATSNEVLHTPLRRTKSTPDRSAFSSPPTSFLAGKSNFVSLDRVSSLESVLSRCSGEHNQFEGSQFRSMSPADELEKVAALHSKGSGKMEKLEWKISPNRGSNLPNGIGLESPMNSLKPTGGAYPLVDSDVKGEAALPPRYIKGPSDTEKRRVHSSTFQSFARSFSFTSAPSSSAHD